MDAHPFRSSLSLCPCRSGPPLMPAALTDRALSILMSSVAAFFLAPTSGSEQGSEWVTETVQHGLCGQGCLHHPAAGCCGLCWRGSPKTAPTPARKLVRLDLSCVSKGMAEVRLGRALNARPRICSPSAGREPWGRGPGLGGLFLRADPPIMPGALRPHPLPSHLLVLQISAPRTLLREVLPDLFMLSGFL